MILLRLAFAYTVFIGLALALASESAPRRFDVVKRASSSCTFSDVSSLQKGKASCTDIVLNGIQVPAGTTLDLNGLKPNTRVTFAGTTTFGYKEWEGE